MQQYRGSSQDGCNEKAMLFLADLRILPEVNLASFCKSLLNYELEKAMTY
jgi:hypothetical protein